MVEPVVGPGPDWPPGRGRNTVEQLEAGLGLRPPTAVHRVDRSGPTTDADDLALSVPGAEEPPD
jgi:hypothetical protein